MFKNVAQVEVKVNDKVYRLICDNDSPIADFKEALFQFQKFAASVEDAAREAQEKAKKETPTQEGVECQI